MSLASRPARTCSRTPTGARAGRHRTNVAPLLSYGSETKGNSLLASIEVGQALALGNSGWTVEPQPQLIHQYLSLDITQITGAIVQSKADDGWIVRAGVRLKGQIDTGLGLLQRYRRVNVYKSSNGTDVARFISPVGGTSTELAGGFTLALSLRTSVYGEVGKL